MVWDAGSRVVTFDGRDALVARRDMTVAEAKSLVAILAAYELRPPGKPADLYRSVWISDVGFVVYRACFDETKCSVREGALAHRQAAFVDEVAALHYCKYRNDLIDRNGTDAIA